MMVWDSPDKKWIFPASFLTLQMMEVVEDANFFHVALLSNLKETDLQLPKDSCHILLKEDCYLPEAGCLVSTDGATVPSTTIVKQDVIV